LDSNNEQQLALLEKYQDSSSSYIDQWNPSTSNLSFITEILSSFLFLDLKHRLEKSHPYSPHGGLFPSDHLRGFWMQQSQQVPNRVWRNEGGVLGGESGHRFFDLSLRWNITSKDDTCVNELEAIIWTGNEPASRLSLQSQLFFGRLQHKRRERHQDRRNADSLGRLWRRDHLRSSAECKVSSSGSQWNNGRRGQPIFNGQFPAEIKHDPANDRLFERGIDHPLSTWMGCSSLLQPFPPPPFLWGRTLGASQNSERKQKLIGSC
jgi:hypothetical protein